MSRTGDIRRRRLVRSGTLVALALAALAALWPVALPARSCAATVAGDASPSLVQAGFITKFPLFVSWPAQAWRPGERPFVIGVFGDEAVVEDLQRLAPYSGIGGSRIEVRRLGSLDGLADCQIVYIGASAAGRIDEIVAALHGRPVLTVADGAGLAARGIHISFYLEGRRVGFELNQHACEAAGLALDFRLRSVARLVE